MLGIPIGIFTANALEWAAHRYILHDRGRNRESFWAFHWHEHHAQSRRNGFRDPNYERSVLHWNAQAKEAVALLASSALTWPLVPVAPLFVLTLHGCALNYYIKHKRSHLDPEWARVHLPWHYDHHMGPDQEANWCVTRPWFDQIMGTRKPWVGTEAEARQHEKILRVMSTRGHPMSQAESPTQIA